MMRIERPLDPLKMFYCYAHEDEALCDQLDMHLNGLKRTFSINTFRLFDLPGKKWEQDLSQDLHSAHIVLLLISPDFFGSQDIQSLAEETITQRYEHKKNKARIIPVLLRQCQWQDMPGIGHLDILPQNHRPIANWLDEDEAFCNVAKKVRETAKDLRTNLWQNEAEILYQKKEYDKALLIYDQILDLNPDNLTIHICRGNVLLDLERYNEAIQAYERAAETPATSIGTIFQKRNPAQERLFYEEASRQYNILFYDTLSEDGIERLLEHTHKRLKEEAVVQLEEAIQNSPYNPFLYHMKGNIYFEQEKYIEAIKQYEQAIRLKPDLETSRTYFSEAIDHISRETYRALNILARRELEEANHIRDSRSS